MKGMELNKLNDNIDFHKIHLREFETRLERKKKKFRLDRHFLAHHYSKLSGDGTMMVVRTLQMLPRP